MNPRAFVSAVRRFVLARSRADLVAANNVCAVRAAARSAAIVAPRILQQANRRAVRQRAIGTILRQREQLGSAIGNWIRGHNNREAKFAVLEVNGSFIAKNARFQTRTAKMRGKTLNFDQQRNGYGLKL